MSSHEPEKPEIAATPAEQSTVEQTDADATAKLTSSSDIVTPSTTPNNDPQQPQQQQPDGLGSRKKSRLQWDEENLTLNAAEMERAGPRMKIDEPKTPYAGGSASENGSSASDSAHQSPPESPAFIPRDRLVGFNVLENDITQDNKHKNSNSNSNSNNSSHTKSNRRDSSTSGGNISDGASSIGSGSGGGRSVHINDDNLATSAGSSPRSKELFAMRRRAHYRNEARVFDWIDDDDESDNDDGNDDNQENVVADVVRGVTGTLQQNGDDDTQTNEQNGFPDQPTTEKAASDTNGHHTEDQNES